MRKTAFFFLGNIPDPWTISEKLAAHRWRWKGRLQTIAQHKNVAQRYAPLKWEWSVFSSGFFALWLPSCTACHRCFPRYLFFLHYGFRSKRSALDNSSKPLSTNSVSSASSLLHFGWVKPILLIFHFSFRERQQLFFDTQMNSHTRVSAFRRTFLVKCQRMYGLC